MLKNLLVILFAILLFVAFICWMYRPGEIIAPYLFLSIPFLPFWKKQNIAPAVPGTLLENYRAAKYKALPKYTTSEFVAQQRAVLAESTPEPTTTCEEIPAMNTIPATNDLPVTQGFVSAEERHEMKMQYQQELAREEGTDYQEKFTMIAATIRDRFHFEPSKAVLKSLPNEQVYGASFYNYRTFGRALYRAEQMELIGVENQDGREIYRLRDMTTGQHYITFMAPKEYGKPDSHGYRRSVLCWNVLKWNGTKWVRHYSHQKALDAAFKEGTPGNDNGPWNPHRYAVQMGVVTALLMGWDIFIQGGKSEKGYKRIEDYYGFAEAAANKITS